MADQLEDLLLVINFFSKVTVEQFQELLEVIPVDIFRNNQYIDYLFVRTALERQRIDVAFFLIDNGFRVYRDHKSERTETPLHYAVDFGDLSLVNKLLNRGAISDVGTQNEIGQTPVHLAIETNQITIMELFLSTIDITILDNQYLLHYAIKKSKLEMVNLLLQKGFSLTKKNKDNETPFCIAVKMLDLAILDSLWSSYDIENCLSDDYTNIALTYIASITGNINFLKKSISTGFPINRPIQCCPSDWSVLRDCAGCTLFFLAVEHVQLKIVEFLFKNGADFTIKNERGISPLCLAVKAETDKVWQNQVQHENNDKIIDNILKASIKLNVCQSNEQKVLYLHAACMRDQPEMLEYFLKNGASVNDSINLTTSPYYKFFPLHLAAKYGCRKNVKMLLKYGGNVNQEGFQKITPLHVASKETSIEIVELLIRHGANIFNKDAFGNTPVHYAFISKQFAILDLLLSAQTIANTNPSNDVGISHFHIACSRNNVNTVKSFIKNGLDINECVPIDSKIKYSKHYNDTDWHGCSPIHFAVSFNKSKIVRLLLKNNANIEIKDARGFTPLHLACQYVDNKFGELIQNSLDNAKSYEKLEEQCESCRSIDSNLKKEMKNENQLNKFIKIVDWSVNRKEHIKIINLLIKHRSNVKCLDNFGNGPLFYACHLNVNGIMEAAHGSAGLQTIFKDQISTYLYKEMDTRRNLILNILFQTNANPNKCYKHSSILHYICLSNIMSDEKKIELAKLFLQNGTDVNAKNEIMQTPLHSAVKVMDERLVKLFIIYNADVNSIDSEKRSPLHIATSLNVCAQNANIITLLIKKKSNVNLKQIDGTTPLHHLVSQSLCDYSDFETLIYSLIEHGADVNSQDVHGKTALFMACSQQNEAVGSLIDCGADINIEDRHGKNVLYYIYKNQAKPLYVTNQSLNSSLVRMLATLYNHLIKLTTMGLYVSKNNLINRSKLRMILKKYLSKFLDEDEQEKISECKQEIEIMKSIKIDFKNSLCDIMFKDETSMTKHIKNDTLRKIVQSDDFNKKFPIYGNFLEIKCMKGVRRYVYENYAKTVIRCLSGFNLPAICSENILAYFNYYELKEFVDFSCLAISKGKHSKPHMPPRVLRSSTKYQRVN